MRIATTLALAMVLSGCRGPLVFTCTDDSVCVRGGATGGACTGSSGATSRYCAFSDGSCAGRLRFDTTAGEGLSGVCVGAGSGVVDGGAADSLPGRPIAWTSLNSGTNENFWSVGGYDAMHLWAGGTGGVWYTADGGKTWTQQKTPMDVVDITGIFAVPGSAWLVGWYGTLLHSSDDGAHWDAQVNPAMTDMYGVWGTGARNVYACGNSGAMIHTTDGVHWDLQNTNAGSHLFSVWGAGPKDVYSAGAGGTIVHSSDEGQTWQIQSTGVATDLIGVWGVGALDVFASGDQRVILHKGLAGWSTVMPPGAMDTSFQKIWGSGPLDVYAVGNNGGIVHSVDGKAFTTETSGSSTLLTAIWGSSAVNVFVVGDSGLILRGRPGL